MFCIRILPHPSRVNSSKYISTEYFKSVGQLGSKLLLHLRNNSSITGVYGVPRTGQYANVHEYAVVRTAPLAASIHRRGAVRYTHRQRAVRGYVLRSTCRPTRPWDDVALTRSIVELKSKFSQHPYSITEYFYGVLPS